MSEGQGTMHFSREATTLMGELLRLDAEALNPTSDFGSGPSERLRKIRDALGRLGLPADELLRHGMSRIVYVARLSDECLFSAPSSDRSYADSGPPAEQVCEWWRERWLSRRIKAEGLLDALSTLTPEGLLLSRELEAHAEAQPIQPDDDPQLAEVNLEL